MELPGTCYEFTYKFLPESILRVDIPPHVPPLPKELYNSTYGIFPLARYIFPLQDKFPPSSLVFMGLPSKIVPFPLFEAQMAAHLRVLANPETLDTAQEAAEVITRYEHLRCALGDDPLRIAKALNVLGQEQFDYRDWLYKFAAKGDRSAVTRVHEWEKRTFLNRRVLRRFWVGLEKKGEAEEWVRGVGEGGLHEWVDFMDRLIRLGEEKEKKQGY